MSELVMGFAQDHLRASSLPHRLGDGTEPVG